MPAKIFIAVCLLFILSIFQLCHAQQPKLVLPIGHTNQVLNAQFSADGKKVITLSGDGTAKLWEAGSGKLIADFKAGGDASIVFIESAQFAPDGNKVIIGYENGGGSKLVDIHNGKNWDDWYYQQFEINQFSPDGKRIILNDTIYNTDTQIQILPLKGNKGNDKLAVYSPDGKKIITVSYNSEATASLGINDPATGKLMNSAYYNAIRLWDATTGKPITEYKKQGGEVKTVLFSPDSKKILILNDDLNTTKVIDAATGNQAVILKEYKTYEGKEMTVFSPDGKRILQLSGFYRNYIDSFKISVNYYDSATVWDVPTGKLLYKINHLQQYADTAYFSPDGKKIILLSAENIIALRDAATGKKLFELTGHKDTIHSARFSPDGKKIITASADKTVKIWNAETGKMLNEISGHTATVNDARFSPDGNKIVTASADHTAKIWDAVSGKEISTMKGRSISLKSASFSADGKEIFIYSEHTAWKWNIEKSNYTTITTGIENTENINKKNDAHTSLIPGRPGGLEILSPDSTYSLNWGVDIINIFNNRTGSFYGFWTPEKEVYNDVQFSPDSKKLLTTSKSNNIKLFDIETEKVLYTFIVVDSTDFLVADAHGHYEGTQNARKLLYFTCGDEVIGLDQVKDQLWVPGLVQRIMTGDSINAKTLDDLGICGLTPLVEEAGSNNTEYRFTIKSRRGGLGETVVYVNGIEARRYQPGELKNNAGNFELVIAKAALQDLFIAGHENPVTVKAFTTDNNIASRGVVIQANKTSDAFTPPNLYAIMIGISDYKGNELDLKYAAKDATDIAAVVGHAAKKLLNKDGKEHVFMYNLTTASEHYLLPEKNSVIKVLEEIGKKATANDILLFFFAGHGVMSGESDKKQFYFLTADASSLTVAETLKNVGISTNELTELIKPQVIKAQKRILIFDACNSGQAINDFVKLGNEDQQFIAARNDDKTQQLKAIDKLNEKSGLFILSASASNQSAYEMGRYSQGLLTYSLLKAIKQQPDILEDGKYLNIGRWFNAAEKTVSEISKETLSLIHI